MFDFFIKYPYWAATTVTGTFVVLFIMIVFMSNLFDKNRIKSKKTPHK